MAAPQSPPTPPEGRRRINDVRLGRLSGLPSKPPKITGSGVAVKTGGPPSDRTAKWPKAPGGRQKKRPMGMPWVKNSVAGDY